jgi:hypothetical protein
LDDTPELVFVVRHVFAVSDLSVASVLYVNPLAGMAGFSEQLRSERTTVDGRLGQLGAGEFAEGGKNVREIDEVIAGAAGLDASGPAHDERDVGGIYPDHRTSLALGGNRGHGRAGRIAVHHDIMQR